ncbi:MAG: hypothetical protein ACYCUV_10700, partial [Phycisphaerae bacterium]
TDCFNPVPIDALLDRVQATVSLGLSRREACRFNRHGICYAPPDIPSGPAPARHRRRPAQAPAARRNSWLRNY